MAHDVFICHSSEDRAIANAACAKLESAGIRCWVAPRDAMAGIPYGRQLVDGIGQARLVLLIFSGHTNRSEHVLRELEIAADRDKIIVPFRIEDVLPSGDLEYYIRRVHWLDAMTPPMDARLRELVTLVQRILATITTPAQEVRAPAEEVHVPPAAEAEPATRRAAKPAPTATIEAEDASAAAVGKAWRWWLAGFVLLVLKTYLLSRFAREAYIGNTPDAATVLPSLLWSSFCLAIYATAAWLLFAAVRRGNNVARRILQIGWPAAAVLGALLVLRQGTWALPMLVLFIILGLWLRMAFLLNTAGKPRPTAGASRTEAPAFIAALVALVAAFFQSFLR